MSGRYWLLLEKSDETRISQGIDGYRDRTGEEYRYDSLVSNHKQLSAGDIVILRKENDILGAGRIDSVTQSPDAKIHRRCPKCESTDIRERKTKSPRFKCGKCTSLFEYPVETIVDVQSYVASIVGFEKFSAPPTVDEVKSCAAKGDGLKSQLSMMELDPEAICALVESAAPNLAFDTPNGEKAGQGFGLSHEERKAVELRAMTIAKELYEELGWTLVDSSTSHPYDYYATCDGDHRFIEVKGTTGAGVSIVLTHGEIIHVLQNMSHSALVVVSDIELAKAIDGIMALGGKISTHRDPWVLYEADLEPTEYRYTINGKP